MTSKNVLYAAVGAPVVAARRVAEAVAELRSTLNKEADTLGKTANRRVALWADEGERLVNRITDAKMVDELTSKVDFDQVSNQVSKLRDQLEEMLTTWRASFRPERMPTVTVEASPQALKVEAKTQATKPASRKAQGPKSPSQKTVAKKVPDRARKAASKSQTAAKAAAKAPSAKKGSARKTAASTTAKKTAAAARKSVSVAG
jgi:hypothetical protein